MRRARPTKPHLCGTLASCLNLPVLSIPNPFSWRHPVSQFQFDSTEEPPQAANQLASVEVEMCLNLGGGDAFCGEPCSEPRRPLFGGQQLRPLQKSLLRIRSSLAEFYCEDPAETLALAECPEEWQEEPTHERQATTNIATSRLQLLFAAIQRARRNLAEFYRNSPADGHEDEDEAV